MSEHKNTLAEMLAGKREFLRLVTLATVLSFSVGVLASLVAASTVVPTIAIYVAASLLTATALLLLAADIRQKLAFEDRLEGVIFIDGAKNELLDVRGYELANDLSRAMAAVKVESRAIYSEWENDPLVQKKEKDEPKPPPTDNRHDQKTHEETSYISIVRVEVDDDHLTKQKASRLLDEALQFVLLEELSTHLSTYFNNSNSDQIAELSREDIPAFLLQNRVLNLLTTPIEQRDVFLKAFPNQTKRPDGVLCSLWGSDGSMYSRFDLNLPKDSKVSFLSRGALRIETKRLDLEISGRYTGSSAAVSRTFVDHYMGRSWDEVDCRKVEVILKGRVKTLALLSDKGWEHYHWLDSFRTRLRKSVDLESFQDEIHWNAVEPMLYTLRGQFTSIHKHLEHLRQEERGLTPHSTGPAQEAAQAGEFKR
jgi:hypothetical protein